MRESLSNAMVITKSFPAAKLKLRSSASHVGRLKAWVMWCGCKFSALENRAKPEGSTASPWRAAVVAAHKRVGRQKHSFLVSEREESLLPGALLCEELRGCVSGCGWNGRSKTGTSVLAPELKGWRAPAPLCARVAELCARLADQEAKKGTGRGSRASPVQSSS